MGGPGLTLGAITLQSFGDVLYGTFLGSVPAPLFVFLGVCQTAFVFLVITRFRLPREGRGDLILANVLTAICFLSVYFALKHLPPAICTSVEIGISLLVAIGLTSIQSKAWPTLVRALACLGILAGCALLTWAEIAIAVPDADATLIWAAILASTATGATSALFAGTSRKLAAKGWTPSAVLAHRFHLTIALAMLWLLLDNKELAIPDTCTLALTSAIGSVAILVPLLLFQMALRRADELTVLICSAAQPMLGFLLALPSPAYDWSGLTLFGVMVVTAFVGWDIVGRLGTSFSPLMARKADAI